MNNLERRVLANMDATPSIWWRCIDDIFSIWPHDEEQLLEFLKKINQFHPSVKFTAEWSVKSVAFLNATVMVNNADV